MARTLIRALSFIMNKKIGYEKETKCEFDKRKLASQIGEMLNETYITYTYVYKDIKKPIEECSRRNKEEILDSLKEIKKSPASKKGKTILSNLEQYCLDEGWEIERSIPEEEARIEIAVNNLRIGSKTIDMLEEVKIVEAISNERSMYANIPRIGRIKKWEIRYL
jgi:hypothetical protein